ncbi:haloacid dehalogenase type II [Pinisolibacter aquiterrae]|uniref:haloacid dehalogenase type II n=1 Tax=Pinisolibacter aquiterrae TaxID=2815579 RepID=UPI001C3DF699|nr:haloacid dehalogenase type II [Pinisolibacter aquiterrae]MBV5263205.1 haloacid dehalogenase type II [Pinisolibacter aquiterrae]MCC8234119.1 haloacid dehalogenase type II [Pinisolibacter aquiterrae]
MAHAIYVFDGYGTLFDVHAAVRRHADEVGPEGQLLSALWRAKQLEYSWMLTMMGRYRDFWVLTEEALDYAFERVPEANRASRAALLDAYWTCDVHTDVPEVLKQLKLRGAKIVILSNGTPKMLDAACRSAGIDDVVDEIISVDEIKVYKPDPRVYDLVTTRFRCFPEAVSFQSSNRWDAAGATAFGFRSVWVNRNGLPEEYHDFRPAAVLPSLEGLLALG